MVRGQVAVAIELSVSEGWELDELARRARIVLLAAEGLENKTTVAELGAAPTRRRTLEKTPADATHWSSHSMARSIGYAPSTIHRIWRAFGLQPHRSKSF